ncbi:hypothetical protein COU60_01200 [Candidatus Pacearchaeota archaeon CG10_big_fil_rev_8_21_14_0_10_34_76]|nr:MAG: hypothetical protein COU60_01200 [Candidatus Pacearchaeota archaeon CG10_big_fil_rev_8_21_14_0_10_34_76]
MVTFRGVEALDPDCGNVFIYRFNGHPNLNMATSYKGLLIESSVSPKDIAVNLIRLDCCFPNGFKSPMDRLVNGPPDGLRADSFDEIFDEIDRDSEFYTPVGRHSFTPIPKEDWETLIERVESERYKEWLIKKLGPRGFYCEFSLG